MAQQFGGRWTEEKLEQLKKYLHAYTQIFTKNERAAFFRTTYFDAFAGSGGRSDRRTASSDSGLLFIDDDEAAEFLKGSAQIALETEPPFDRYVFVEKDPEYALNLAGLLEQFPAIQKKVSIHRGDANDVIGKWTSETDWKKNRAVAFLDPYGMQVDWSTIQSIGRTKAIDLWILFPLGQGVNRLLTKGGPPPANWAARLTRFFGSDEWRSRFYKPTGQANLFGGPEELAKDADFQSIGEYFLERLRTVFCDVAKTALPLRNSRGTPIFLLCFAAANPIGAPTAVKIANGIMNAWQKGK